MQDTILRLKHILDQAAEVIDAHSRVCKAILSPVGSTLDRSASRNVHKSFLDFHRYTGDGPIAGRRDTAARLFRHGGGRVVHLLERYQKWEAHLYTSARYEPALTEETFFHAFEFLTGLSSGFEKELARLEKQSALFEVVTAPPVVLADNWQARAAKEIAGSAPNLVEGLWPSYWHVYVMMAHSGDAAELAAGARACFSERWPALTDKLLFLPAGALKLVLYSNYLTNPFKYYDFVSQPFFVAKGRQKPAVAEPPHPLTRVMAKEAILKSLLTIRLEPVRKKVVLPIYSAFLRALRLRLFFEKKLLVVRLADVPDAYRQEYGGEADWVSLLREEATKRGIGVDEYFLRFFPPVKRALDSVRDSDLWEKPSDKRTSGL